MGGGGHRQKYRGEEGGGYQFMCRRAPLLSNSGLYPFSPTPPTPDKDLVVFLKVVGGDRLPLLPQIGVPTSLVTFISLISKITVIKIHRGFDDLNGCHGDWHIEMIYLTPVWSQRWWSRHRISLACVLRCHCCPWLQGCVPKVASESDSG